MISAVDLCRPPGALGLNVDNFLTIRIVDDRIGLPAGVGAARTVRLPLRRRTFPEWFRCGWQSCFGGVQTVVDNFALRELCVLALAQ